MTRTVSLETAKQLKEAGFSQDSPFNWVEYSSEYMPKVFFSEYGLDTVRYIKICSAPTTDELLEELPITIPYFDKQGNLGMCKHEKGYSVYYEVENDYEKSSIFNVFVNESLPEALAQMWLWLKKEGLL